MKRSWLLAICLLPALVGLAGCPNPTPVDGPHTRGPAGPGPGPEEPITSPPVKQTGQGPVIERPREVALQGRLTNADKQRVIQDTLISLQRVIISSNEQLALAGGAEQSTVGREAMISKLAELGFTVIETTQQIGYSPSEASQDQFRRRNRCNLVFLLDSKASQYDKFGNYYSFQSRMRGKVLNLTTHQILAQKSVNRRGKRALDEVQAAESAEALAAEDMATYFTDEIVRRWEATSLVKMDLTVGNLKNVQMAYNLRKQLQNRVGIYYVSLESWDDDSDVGVFEVLCRFDVRQLLGQYVDELRRGGLTVQNYQQAGEVVEARRRTFH